LFVKFISIYSGSQFNAAIFKVFAHLILYSVFLYCHSFVSLLWKILIDLYIVHRSGRSLTCILHFIHKLRQVSTFRLDTLDLAQQGCPKFWFPLLFLIWNKYQSKKDTFIGLFNFI
jgi:hypothetical protein